ncbi:hypothetical protein BJV82DRAFT_405742 [Fennellomyces sp. T-0311]|nr:hypothetical protein BJV82DRAFT_405742 [Fennellomyces sp. T-0311]
MEVVKQLGLAFGADWDAFGVRKSWQPQTGKTLTHAEHRQVIGRATTAIDELQGQLLDLLDVRARSYSILKEFDNALQDASAMIRNSPSTFKGYYRAGMIQILQDRYDEAICTYHKGLTMLSKSDTGYKKLKVVAEKAENTLDKRAAAHAKSGDFVGGLQIARELIYAAPKSAKGYLRAGEICCMQGKSTLAVEIYEEALQSVSPVDPRYGLLAEEHRNALAQSDKRIDFPGLLPFEILANIFPLLSTAELVECGSVCHRWRERVIQCTEAWHDVTLKCADDIALVEPVAMHIRKLWLNFLEDWEMQEFLEKMVVDGEVRYLESLAIESGVEFEPTFCTDVVLQSQSGISLTELYISIDIPGMVPVLGHVLSECPNLSHLTYEAPDFDRIIGKTPLPEKRPILRACPKLRCLVVDHCAPNALGAISQICPNVTYFHYGSADEDVCDIDQTTPWDWPTVVPNVYGPAGSRFISITADDAEINRRDVISILSKNAATVEELNLNIHMDENRFPYTPAWEPLINFGGERLRVFECTLGCRTSVLSSIFYRSPALENIVIQGMQYLTNAIFNSLRDLPNLKCLRLFDCSGLSEDGLTAYFEKMAQHHHTSLLEELEFADMAGITDQSLGALLDIKSLRILSLTRCNSVTGIGLNEFLEKMRNMRSSLEEINFMQMDSVTDLTLCALGTIEGLKRVKLSLLNGVTDRGLVSLACDFEKYEHVNGTSTIALRRS